jgi:hypothetical protein
VCHPSTVDVPANEERIRELCAMAISARQGEWEPILVQLRSAIQEHVAFLREMTAVMREAESANDTVANAAD